MVGRVYHDQKDATFFGLSSRKLTWLAGKWARDWRCISYGKIPASISQRVVSLPEGSCSFLGLRNRKSFCNALCVFLWEHACLVVDVAGMLLLCLHGFFPWFECRTSLGMQKKSGGGTQVVLECQIMDFLMLTAHAQQPRAQIENP